MIFHRPRLMLRAVIVSGPWTMRPRNFEPGVKGIRLTRSSIPLILQPETGGI
jgi:hypothetical protein